MRVTYEMSESVSDTTAVRFPKPATVPDQRPRWEGWEVKLPSATAERR